MRWILLLLLWLLGCNGIDMEPARAPQEVNKQEEAEHEPAKPAPLSEPPVVVETRYEYRLQFTVELKATCYSKYDPGDPGHGRYANDDMTELPIQERRINRHHYTVALPPEYNDQHRELIWLPGTGWRHRWGIHVPGYNNEREYLSVPRDRMKQRGRIDVLFTTAGKYFDIPQRQRHWGAPMKLCEFWKIVRIKKYSDGKEVVE